MAPVNSVSPSLPQGFIPVMLTPFNETGAVDFECLSLLTDFYLNAGAKGLFANCLSSEMYELTEQERLAITQTVVHQVAGRVPVVATGTFGGSIAKQADFIKRIYQTGVSAVIAITGLLATEDEDDEVFLQNAFELLNRTENIPLGFYECPVPYKRLVNRYALRELVKTGRVIYHKDTCLNLDEVKRRIEIGKGHQFGLYDAYMVNAVASMRAGAAGLSCIQGNIYPDLVVWICHHYNDITQEAGVTRLQRFFEETMDGVHAAYPVIAKYSLQKRGFPISMYTRRNVEPLTTNLMLKMDAILDEAEQIRKELGIADLFKKYLIDK